MGGTVDKGQHALVVWKRHKSTILVCSYVRSVVFCKVFADKGNRCSKDNKQTRTGHEREKGPQNRHPHDSGK